MIYLKEWVTTMIDSVEDLLENHGVRIDAADKEMRDNGMEPGMDNSAVLYGTVYDELENYLLKILEQLVHSLRPGYDQINCEEFGESDYSYSDDEQETIYREKEHTYARLDAEQHLVDDESVVSYDEADLYILADRFLIRHDCNVADNDLWNQIIREFVQNHE
jgi:hypothetical protein